MSFWGNQGEQIRSKVHPTDPVESVNFVCDGQAVAIKAARNEGGPKYQILRVSWRDRPPVKDSGASTPIDKSQIWWYNGFKEEAAVQHTPAAESFKKEEN